MKQPRELDIVATKEQRMRISRAKAEITKASGLSVIPVEEDWPYKELPERETTPMERAMLQATTNAALNAIIEGNGIESVLDALEYALISYQLAGLTSSYSVYLSWYTPLVNVLRDLEIDI